MADTSTRIGLWGGPGSGKTTFLASLKIAALLKNSGNWYIYGDDRVCAGSVKHLAIATTDLRNGNFPGNTLEVEVHAYRIKGTVEEKLLDKLFSGFKNQKLDIVLYVQDFPGGFFAKETDPNAEIWNYFANCKGLVYLYDFAKEERGEAYNFDSVQFLVDYLLQREDVALIDGYLPHYLSICVTKYDDPVVIEKLQKAEPNIIKSDPQDPRNTPYIKDPQKAFEILADPLVKETLERNFIPSRVNYFCTSSIGFYAPKDSQVDLGDYVNVIETQRGSNKIRNARHLVPVNVIEPLVWLQHSIQKAG